MLSSDLPSALMPSFISVAAAISISSAAKAYPALTLPLEWDAISQPKSSGEAPPPIAVPSA